MSKAPDNTPVFANARDLRASTEFKFWMDSAIHQAPERQHACPRDFKRMFPLLKDRVSSYGEIPRLFGHPLNRGTRPYPGPHCIRRRVGKEQLWC